MVTCGPRRPGWPKEFADIDFSEGGAGSGPLFNTLLQAVINSLHDRSVNRQIDVSVGGGGQGRMSFCE